jgi:hypothetical protein
VPGIQVTGKLSVPDDAPDDNRAVTEQFCPLADAMEAL